MEKAKKMKESLYFILFIIFEELVFSCLIFGGITINFLMTILLSIPIGLLLSIISSMFKRKINISITYFIVVLIAFIMSAQLIYYRMYETIISFVSFMNGGQVTEFMEIILGYLWSNWYALALFFLPVIILVLGHIFKKISFEKAEKRNTFIKLGALVIVQVVAILIIIFVSPNRIYSNKNLYYNIHVPKLTANRMGLFTTMRLDFQRYIFKVEENLTIEASAKPYEEEGIEYNVKDIDFDELIKSESNKAIIQVNEYMKNEQPTNKNEYTGMFEGKNLIVIVGESFSDIAIDKELTPTLYRLYNEGFQFDNFYTALFPVSTADGEYHTDTALLPKEGIWSMYEIVRK